MSIFLSLFVSLTITLAAELLYALVWGVSRQDLGLIALINLLTNPPVMLLHAIAAIYMPRALIIVTAALECAAVLIEWQIISRRSDIRLPFLFALCANIFSFTLGLLL